jgi:hypothetical protein
MWIGFISPRIDSNAGFCKHGNELSDVIKGKEFFGK